MQGYFEGRNHIGVADGAQKTLAEIIALNVRTEINFGLFSDGCTALSWLHQDCSILAQNWDVSYMFTISHHLFFPLVFAFFL
jgi:hypothetical protein